MKITDCLKKKPRLSKIKDNLMHKILVPDGGNDDFNTPHKLCRQCIDKLPLNRNTTTLEPCRGSGNFYHLLANTKRDWCEIKEGRDFFDYRGHVDWIITNPPWSLARRFLIKSMQVSDNIGFLITINHIVALKARWRDIRSCGFRITKIYLVNTPKEFPQSGFQLGFCIIQKKIYKTKDELMVWDFSLLNKKQSK